MIESYIKGINNNNNSNNNNRIIMIALFHWFMGCAKCIARELGEISKY